VDLRVPWSFEGGGRDSFELREGSLDPGEGSLEAGFVGFFHFVLFLEVDLAEKK
jgi:hypothetical protein